MTEQPVVLITMRVTDLTEVPDDNEVAPCTECGEECAVTREEGQLMDIPPLDEIDEVVCLQCAHDYIQEQENNLSTQTGDDNFAGLAG